MAGSLIALLDDIAYLMDDIATLSKVGAQKTVAVVGDDIAVSANTLVGSMANRELPIVWKITKGSLLNKLIIVPLVLVFSELAPALMPYVMLLGGLYLCLEGAEKVIGHFKKKKDEVKVEGEVIHSFDPHMLEDEKVKGAIRTDAVLSLEIVVIALGSIQAAGFLSKALTLSLLSFAITIFVYSLVALIVKLDDIGLAMSKMNMAFAKLVGRGLLNSAPLMMHILTILGTLAMFSVGGEIIMHQFHAVEVFLEPVTGAAPQFKLGFTVIFGFILGLMTVPFAHLLERIAKKRS